MHLPPGLERSLLAPFDPNFPPAAKYPFEQMDVGDYFFVQTVLDTRLEAIRQSARGWARRRGLNDRKFSVRRVPAVEGQPPSRTVCVRVR